MFISPKLVALYLKNKLKNNMPILSKGINAKSFSNESKRMILFNDLCRILV